MNPAPNAKIDLTNCDREPIHVLGNIQSFGFLVAVTADRMIARVSANRACFIGIAPEAVLALRGRGAGTGRGRLEAGAAHAFSVFQAMIT